MTHELNGLMNGSELNGDYLKDRVVPPKEAAYMLGISRSTLFVLAAEDSEFPPRIQITERRCGWRYSDLLHYIEARTLKGSVH